MQFSVVSSRFSVNAEPISVWNPALRTENPEQRTRSALALRELESLSCAFLAVLFTFLAASIAGEEAFSFQSFAQFGIELEQRTGNAHLDCVGLAVDAAARDAGNHVERGRGLGGLQRTPCRVALCFGDEVFVDLAAVDGG